MRTSTALVATLALSTLGLGEAVATKSNLRQRQRNLSSATGNPYERTFATMDYYFDNSGCTLSTKGVKSTTLDCTRPGFTSTLTYSGVSPPVPQSIESCTLMTGGNTQCSTYSFKSNPSDSQIDKTMSQALPGATVPSNMVYYIMLSETLLYFDGNGCKTTTDTKADTVTTTCTMSGYEATLSASRVTKPFAETLKTCMLGSGSSKCTTYQLKGSGSMSAAAVLVDAFNTQRWS